MTELSPVTTAKSARPIGSCATAVAILLALLACTEPGLPRHPLGGVYDVTTSLDTFSFETGGSNQADCPGQFNYCTHDRAFTEATPSGTLELSVDRDRLYPLDAAGVLSGFMCDAIDFQNLSGCLHVAPRSEAYSAVPAAAANEFGDSTISVLLSVDGPEETRYSRPFVYLSGVLRNDSPSGRIWWASQQGRSPPTHSGTFVATRRR